MAVFSGEFLSSSLGRHTNISVILPHDIYKAPKWGFPVLYLLHGKTDDHRTWLYRSNIERYAAERCMCVVMPDAGLSYYTDMYAGGRYHTFIANELPAFIADTFRISVRREDTYIAGASMGGYGALAISLSHPEKYAGCIALSAVTDIFAAASRDVADKEISMWRGISGETARPDKRLDLFRMIDDIPGMTTILPKFYIACGKNDELFEQNLRLRDALDNHRIDFTFEQAAAGHEWGFWDVAIQRGLDIVTAK